MSVRQSIINAVASLETVDMSIQRLAFPVEFEHNSQKVEFDVYEGGTEIALKGNFLKQSNVVTKDGYKTVTVNPMQVNESIADTGSNVNKKRIGQSIYGGNNTISDAERNMLEDDMMGFGKLKKRKERLLKKSMYDVLVTGAVTVSESGVAADSIDYGLTNKVVNDNATAGQYQWNDTTNSNPVEQLELYALGMGMHAVDTFVLGFEAHKAWSKHPKVQTSDNTTTGKKANFYPATKDERAAKSTEKFLFLGTTAGDYGGKALEIYADVDQYNDGTTDQYYLDKNYAVGFKRGNQENGQVQYGNITIVEGENEGAKIGTFVGKEHIDGWVQKDPVSVKRLYKSSPLPTMNQPKAFVSIKATLIA